MSEPTTLNPPFRTLDPPPEEPKPWLRVPTNLPHRLFAISLLCVLFFCLLFVPCVILDVVTGHYRDGKGIGLLIFNYSSAVLGIIIGLALIPMGLYYLFVLLFKKLFSFLFSVIAGKETFPTL